MKKYLSIYVIIAALLCPLLQFLTWGLSSRIFEYILFNVEAERGGSQADFILSWGFGYCMQEGFAMMQVVLPLLPLLISFGFVRLYKGYYTNAKPRTTRYTAFVAKDILAISLIGAIALYLGFVLFYLFGVVTHPIDYDQNWRRAFLNDIFGDGFAWKDPLLYYALEGIYKYIVFPFVYCAFSCSVYVFFKKSYLCVIVPMGFFVVTTVFSSNAASKFYESSPFLYQLLKAVRPDNMLMMGAAGEQIPVWYPLISLILPVMATVFFFVKGILNEKKYN